MGIKITKSDEAISVDQICVTVYSQPANGKTSLAFTANNPLLFDFDKGAYRATNRGDIVQVSSWSDVSGLKESDLEGYDTIVVDTVGKALDFLAQDILRGNQRLGYAGMLNQQGWGQLGVRFGAWLRMVRGMGKDVILIAHMDEQRDGDHTKERLKIQGGSKDVVLTDSDVIARISIENKQRLLMFSPTETSFGKDPAKLGCIEIPSDDSPEFKGFMAVVISDVKDRLNALSEEQIARKGELEWFAEHLPQMKDAGAINAVLGRAKKAGRDVSRSVAQRATELGLDFDAENRKYVYLEETLPDIDDDLVAATDGLGE